MQHSGNVEVRLATEGDLEPCLDLIQRLVDHDREPGWTDTFRALLDRRRGQIVVATVDGVVAGLASVSYNLAIRYGGEYCQLEELIVADAARGLGLGRVLIEATVDNARARGCVEYGLHLVPGSLDNEAFYSKFGMQTLGPAMRMRLVGDGPVG